MWRELSQQSDIDELMRAFGDFHDSCLKEVAIRNREYVSSNLSMGFDNKPIVKLLFQRQFANPAAIELQFEDVENFNWLHTRLTDTTDWGIINQAVFTYYKGLIFWADDANWRIEAGDCDAFRWIGAKTAKWQVIPNSTGADDKLLSFA